MEAKKEICEPGEGVRERRGIGGLKERLLISTLPPVRFVERKEEEAGGREKRKGRRRKRDVSHGVLTRLASFCRSRPQEEGDVDAALAGGKGGGSIWRESAHCLGLA